MAMKKVHVFVTGTMKLFFFVTGQVGMKFGPNLNRRFLKIFPKGVILRKKIHFGVAFLVLVSVFSRCTFTYSYASSFYHYSAQRYCRRNSVYLSVCYVREP